MLSVSTLIANLLPGLHSDSLANLVAWTDEELTRIIADALKRLAQEYGVFVIRDITIVLVQGTAVYGAPTRHVSTLHIAILESGRPLIPSSTKEMELKSSSFATTQAAVATPIRYSYSDKSGANKIGLVPVPGALDAGKHLDVIFHQFPCNLDAAHTDVDIRAPKFVGDWAEAVATSEAYGKESDFQMPETAQSCKTLAMLYEQVIGQLYGVAQ
jgi:hypothetical protein